TLFYTLSLHDALPIYLYDTAAWNRLMGVNATGVFFGMKHGIAAMKKHRRGSVINLSSISGIVGQGFIHVGYNASKGAVRLITKRSEEHTSELQSPCNL